MQERIFQCAACGTRVLRSRPIDRGESCPRCGRSGQLEPFAGQTPRPFERGADWLRGLWAAIDGGKGPLRWK